jgi:sec-independent protein translocase protein TatB
VGSVGTPELLVIFVLALIVIGPERLPGAARTMGGWVREIRKITGSLQQEVQGVVDEVMRPVNEVATQATQTFSTASTDPVDPSLPYVASSDSSAASPASAEGGLAADVPLPGLTATPPAAIPFDPSLN